VQPVSRNALFALTAPSAVLLVAWWLFKHHPAAAATWLLGVTLGAVLQRSRYCIAAAYRDTILFADTGLAHSVLLALAISSITFAAVQALRWPDGQVPLAVQPITAGTFVGPVLFGIGMIPAGGCGGSTLLRLGEGHLRFLWTLLGLILGSLAGAYHYGWWARLAGTAAPVYLPAALGWPGALLLQAGLLFTLFVLIRWWERKGAAL
jgi:uncharacterized protein